MKNIYQTDLVHRYVKILLRGRRETYTVQKTLLVEIICKSRIKRLIWGSRGKKTFLLLRDPLKSLLAVLFTETVPLHKIS